MRKSYLAISRSIVVGLVVLTMSIFSGCLLTPKQQATLTPSDVGTLSTVFVTENDMSDCQVYDGEDFTLYATKPSATYAPYNDIVKLLVDDNDYGLVCEQPGWIVIKYTEPRKISQFTLRSVGETPNWLDMVTDDYLVQAYDMEIKQWYDIVTVTDNRDMIAVHEFPESVLADMVAVYVTSANPYPDGVVRVTYVDFR